MLYVYTIILPNDSSTSGQPYPLRSVTDIIITEKFHVNNEI